MVKRPTTLCMQTFIQTGSGITGVLVFATPRNPFPQMPLTLRVTFTSGPDTTMRVDNTSNQGGGGHLTAQHIADPNNDIVLKQEQHHRSVTGISGSKTKFYRYALLQNYPNPFNQLQD
jgi:hypothetical protein